MIGREILTALARAWAVTTISTALLSAAVAIAPMWDTAIFMQALDEAATSDPSFGRPADMVTTDALIGGGHPGPVRIAASTRNATGAK